MLVSHQKAAHHKLEQLLEIGGIGLVKGGVGKHPGHSLYDLIGNSNKDPVVVELLCVPFDLFRLEVNTPPSAFLHPVAEKTEILKLLILDQLNQPL